MRPFLLVGGLLSLLLLGVPAAQAQRVLLRAEVAQDTARSGFGPNRAYYNHFYLSYAAVVGRAAGPGAALRFGNSAEISAGWRNKFRLTQSLALGADLRLARLAYHLVQNDQKVVPSGALHRREYLALQQVQTEAFVRLNAGRRGNIIGRYLDLTGWGGWAIGSAHYYEDRPAPGASKQQVTERGLRYVQRWPYGVGARLGSGRYALVSRYRLSSTFVGAARTSYPELPRWLVGLELGWF